MESIEIIKAPEELHSSFLMQRQEKSRNGCLQVLLNLNQLSNSNVIKIIVRSHSAQEAELLANTYATAYYDRNLFVSRIRSHSVRDF